MESYLFVYLIIAIGLVYFLIDDFRIGEYSMIRFLLELLLVYGPIILSVFIGFSLFSDQLIVVFVLISTSVIYAFFCRNRIIQFLRRTIPRSYDKMNVHEAVKHLKKDNATPEEIIKYLANHRNLSKAEIHRILNER